MVDLFLLVVLSPSVLFFILSPSVPVLVLVLVLLLLLLELFSECFRLLQLQLGHFYFSGGLLARKKLQYLQTHTYTHIYLHFIYSCITYIHQYHIFTYKSHTVRTKF